MTQKLLEDVGLYQMTAKDHESREGNVKGERKSREQLRSAILTLHHTFTFPAA